MAKQLNFTLHCDDCHHEVSIEGQLGREHVGWPCPVCNSNMLDEADYRAGRVALKIIAFLSFFGLARTLRQGEKVKKGQKVLRITSRDGAVDVTEKTLTAWDRQH